MAIDALRDGYVRVCFDPSLNLVGDQGRLVLEGQFDTGAASAVTADVLTKVTSEADIDDNFGAGTVLATALKTAISCCGNNGVEIFALPRADAGGSTAAVYTATFTGPATSDGRVDIFWGDAQWNISVEVNTGDTADAIAAAVQAAVPSDFPYTATVATNVVTLTAKNAGTVGNYLNAEYNWHGRNGYAPAGVTVTFAQATVGAGNPAVPDYSTIFGECCVTAVALLSDDTTWQAGLAAYLDDAWSCDKPQCFGHGYVYNSGTLGTILATDTNSATLSRMAHDSADPNFPWLKVAAYASKSACQTVDNPEISIQGPTFGILDCVSAPESCASPWTFTEQEQLRDSGFVVTVPVSGGEGSLTSAMITNDITNNRFDDEGRENLTFQSAASRRLATATVVAMAEELQQFNGLGYFTQNTSVRQGTAGTNKAAIRGRMRAWAKSQVGILFSEFDNINEDLVVLDDFETAPRCQGIPGKLALNLIYRPPVRMRQISVNAAPRLLDNC